MSYRLAGRSTEICSCAVPCPCAFGQVPTGGTCEGIFAFSIEEGEMDGVDLSGTKAVLANRFGGAPWTAGNFHAALILDSNATPEQRDALRRILTGEAGGDAANMAGLIGNFEGVFEAPIDYRVDDGEVTVRAGELAEGSGAVLKGLDGEAAIEITNGLYPLPHVFAGKSTRSRVNVGGLSYDNAGSGFYTGPFEMRG